MEELLRITIHRGARQIGGSLTEISTEKSRVFIDFGENLPGARAPSRAVDGLTFGACENSALFLTHYHGDHIGRLAEALPGVPVYMGKTAKAIQMNLAERTDKEKVQMYDRVRTFTPLETIPVGDICVTPLMIDHSAFDAYMFIIQAGEKRILHTGDFRLHGVRGGKTLTMLRSYAKNIDYLVCEGTTLSRSGEPPMTEYALRRAASGMMKAAKYVFVLCSSTNIDRIGAFYHAAPRGRMFVCDMYQKKQLDIVRENHAGKSKYYDFRYIYAYAPNLDAHMAERGFCMLIRQNDFSRRVMEKYKDNCLVIYSMWTGYLDDRAKNQDLFDFLSPYRFRVLHTSGHASPEDIQKLYETVQPKCGLIPIHTDAPEMFIGIAPREKIFFLEDGEPWHCDAINMERGIQEGWGV